MNNFVVTARSNFTERVLFNCLVYRNSVSTSRRAVSLSIMKTESVTAVSGHDWCVM